MTEQQHGDIAVIENALPPRLYQQIKRELYRRDFPWNFLPNTASAADNDPSFNHLFYNDETGYMTPLFPYIHSAFLGMVDMLDQFRDKKISIGRVRGGLIMAGPEPIVHAPHVDFDQDHWTALLYFSTEKDHGHTYLYKNRWNPEKYATSADQIAAEEMELLHTIPAEENKVVFFKGDIFHSSSTPVNISHRVAININFKAW